MVVDEVEVEVEGVGCGVALAVDSVSHWDMRAVRRAQSPSALFSPPSPPRKQNKTNSPSKTAALVCAVVHVLPISFKAPTMVFKSFLACDRRSPSCLGLSEMPSSTAEMARTVPQQKAALLSGYREGERESRG